MPVYDGYSWSITQHIGPVTDKATMTAFLKAAYTYSNDVNPGDRITEDLIAQGLLTENIREDAGRAQTWRDYQQVLSELGLIVSTRFTDNIVVTPVGLMLLDGLIGFSELLTTQCLRYQYPNGHKQDISPSLREELSATMSTTPLTRTELDLAIGIQIKPAVLILRVLLELQQESGELTGISVDQCVKYLMPTPRNSEWRDALANLKEDVEQQRTVDTRRKRHVQEWFRLLDETDLFQVQNSVITLHPSLIGKLADLKQLCERLESQSSFWIPSSTSKAEMALSWFNHYGNPPIEQQWAATKDIQTQDYIQTNYTEGINPAEMVSMQESDSRNWTSQIVLRDFAPNTNEQVNNNQRVRLNIENAIAGLGKRKEQTRLHEYIISRLADRLSELGYKLSDDPLSVDLLATKNHSDEVIFEVKTVTVRSIPHRLRLGIGQLQEYRYRRTIETSRRPLSLLVISSTVTLPNWMVSFLQEELNIGLVGFSDSEKFVAYTSGAIETALTEI